MALTTEKLAMMLGNLKIAQTEISKGLTDLKIGRNKSAQDEVSEGLAGMSQVIEELNSEVVREVIGEIDAETNQIQSKA